MKIFAVLLFTLLPTLAPAMGWKPQPAATGTFHPTPPTPPTPPPAGTFTLPTGSTLKYLRASGSDANCNGTANVDDSAGVRPNCAWSTPNHAMLCGEAIIAQPTALNGSFNSFGTVSNCPSTTGGIDGAGGIWAAILLCGGTDLGSSGCNINCAVAACSAGILGSGGHNAVSACMNVNKSNWAIISFTCAGNGATHRGFQSDGCLTLTTVVHHQIFINDIVTNAAQAFDTDDCGYNGNVPGNGVDYWAVVGSIAHNAAQDPICLAAIDLVAPANSDTTAGTHAFIYGNFGWNNQVTCVSDGEFTMGDTLDAHRWVGTASWQDNIGWSSQRSGFQLFYQNVNAGSSATIIHVYNNTMFHNNVGGTVNTSVAEYYIASTAATLPYSVTVQKNIGVSDFKNGTAGSTSVNYALTMGGNYGVTVGGSGNENIFNGVASPTCAASCDAGDNVIAFNGGSFGTNTYTSAGFTNTADLLASRSGTPNCTGFATTTACMGYNVTTATLTTPSVISDLQSTFTASGDGYQLPSATAAPVTDYPTWLKGLVRLQWNSATSTITQVRDLVTVPSGS